MLTVEEVAAILKVQPLTVRQMFREGRIRGFKIGKAWRTTMPIIEEDIACMSRGMKPPRLEQDASAEEAPVPARKRRAKAAPEAAEPAMSEAVKPAAPEPAREAEPVAEALRAAVEEPAVEEPAAGGKRKRKSAPDESIEQQLLF